MMEESRLLTIDQLAVILQVPRTWLYARTRERSASGLPHVKIGKYVRFRLSEVEAWFRAQHRGWEPRGD